MLLLGSDTITLKQDFGKTWLKIFYHYSKNGDWFTNLTDLYHINTKTRFSILELITSDFKIDNSYEFLLQYPQVSGEYNNWKQEIFPLDSNQSQNTDVGYSCDGSCHCSWTDERWSGLALSENPQETFIDGSHGNGHWWYSIGAKKTYYSSPNLFPGPPLTLVNKVYLWIRVPTHLIRKLRQFTCIKRNYHIYFGHLFVFL